MSSEYNSAGKRKFDTLLPEMPNKNPLEHLPSICAKLSSIPNNIWSPATDTAFTVRLEKALLKNLDYIYMKDNNLLQSKPNNLSFPPAGGISTIIYGRHEKKQCEINNNGIGMKNFEFADAPVSIPDNNRIYISGFPAEFTDEDINILFCTQGKIKKIKFYLDESGNKKGDALLTYVKNESVLLSISKLNGLDIGDGYNLSVALPDFKKEISEKVSRDNPLLELSGNDRDVSYLKSIFENKDSKSPFIQDYRSETFSSSLKSLFSIQLECEKYPVLVISNAYDIDTAFQNDPNYLANVEGDLLLSCCQYGKVKSITTPTELLPTCILAVFIDTQCALKCAYELHNIWFYKRQIKVLLFKPSVLSFESDVIESKDDSNCNTNPVDNDISQQDFDLDNFFNTLL